jgi:hypothetical protein
VQTSVLWPAPVDQRLNELLDRLQATAPGETSRSRLLAALVTAAPNDPLRLRELLDAYGILTAGEVVLQTKGAIKVPMRTPGRRPR